MKTRVLLFSLLLTASPVFAVTLATVRTTIDTYIDSIEVATRNRIVTCLQTQENCQTGWSCATPCNNTAAAGSVCQTTQTDPGELDQCGVATGQNTFASRGITLPAQSYVCFKIDVYSGPGGRGGAIRYRAQHAGTIYEKARGFGPQAATFTYDWRTVTP